MLGALTSRTRATTGSLLREARFDAATERERHSTGEPSPSLSNGSCDINVLRFTTKIKQCVPFLPSGGHCSFKLEIAFCVRGVISPLLANAYLHYVFDLWVQHWRTHRATGEVIVVRYADDMVLGFQHRAEAERFLQDWRERLRKFGLELHPDKTRLIEFGRFAAANRKQRGEGKPETFHFLGFAHICGQARKTGQFLVLRKTIRKRLLAKLKQVKEQLWVRMHQPLAEVGKWLKSVLQGYFNYHAVPGNLASLRSFREEVCKRWMRVIRRRSQKSRTTWEHVARYAQQWLPLPTVLHPYPDLRFDAKHPRQEPHAGILPVRIRAGGAG